MDKKEPKAVKAELPAVKKVEPLGAFVARVEKEAQPLAVTLISHPDAKDGAIYQGKFAGIRQVKGDVFAILSDGKKI